MFIPNLYIYINEKYYYLNNNNNFSIFHLIFKTLNSNLKLVNSFHSFSIFARSGLIADRALRRPWLPFLTPMDYGCVVPGSWPGWRCSRILGTWLDRFLLLFFFHAMVARCRSADLWLPRSGGVLKVLESLEADPPARRGLGYDRWKGVMMYQGTWSTREVLGRWKDPPGGEACRRLRLAGPQGADWRPWGQSARGLCLTERAWGHRSEVSWRSHTTGECEHIQALELAASR